MKGGILPDVVSLLESVCGCLVKIQTVRAVIPACGVAIITAWGATNSSRVLEKLPEMKRHSHSLRPIDVGISLASIFGALPFSFHIRTWALLTLGTGSVL